MKNFEFTDFFNSKFSGRQDKRESTFRKIFSHLDQFDRSILIVETGCARIPGNWEGDGQSTVLFDRYCIARNDNSKILSVDINSKAVEVARTATSIAQIEQGDSIAFLSSLAKHSFMLGKSIDLLYLDSFDVDWENWQPSALHHLKELAASMPMLGPNSLVVVDDCPHTADFIYSPSTSPALSFVTTPRVGGKGRYVSDFITAIGGQLIFSGYQAGWIGIR